MYTDNQELWAGLLLMISIAGFILVPSVSSISDASVVVLVDTLLLALVIITGVASLTMAGASLQHKMQSKQESTKTAILVMLAITYLAFMLAMAYNFVAG